MGEAVGDEVKRGKEGRLCGAGSECCLLFQVSWEPAQASEQKREGIHFRI